VMPEVERALDRAKYGWSEDLSNTEIEQAFLDRAVLAGEVRHLREELVHAERAMTEAELEVVALEMKGPAND
jgi:hypothetical protein